MVELLSTKLYIPRPRPNLISRPRLTERLNAGMERKLTLIAAPAGFGKTTLLSEWIPQSTHCVTWLSLDKSDNDPTRFWAYVIASLQQIHADLAAGAQVLLQSSQPPSITSILTALINDITAFPDRFSTVLDDYHVIESKPIHDALAYLIEHLPENYQLVISTRADPPIPLARLRAHDQLTELRANDLRFTGDEAAAFLAQVTGLRLSADEISALGTRTEGWIAGLQIAALSMQGHGDIPGFIQAFSGSHRHILGYLDDEVLDQRPEGTLNFLLQTSILDRLCGPLCDAVTGDSSGHAMLEKLEQAQLFLSPLDDEGVWYRYHHLFAEVLQARLKRIWPDRVQELHRRAGNWYAQQGLTDEAIHHALAGSDYEGAASLIETTAGSMLRQGAHASLVVWLDAIPEDIVRARPRLCLVSGWIYFMGSALSLESAEQWALHAVKVAQANGSLDASLTGEVAALRAMVAATRSDVLHSIHLAQQALDDLSLDSPWRSAVVFCLGTAHYLSGDMAAAVPVFDEAVRLSQTDGAQHIQLNSASFIAEILMIQGQLRRATEIYQQVLAWADPGLPQKGVVMAHGGLADILCEQDQLDAALSHVQLGVDQVDMVGGVWSAHLLYRVLARVLQARGNWAAAVEALDHTYWIAQSARVSLIVAQVAALQARLHLARGDLEAALIWSASCGLHPDDPQASHPGWREVEYLTLARVLYAQDKPAEALSLLDRLSKSAEAEGRFGSVIANNVLQSMVYQSQGNSLRALESLERALILAEPEGYIRIFVDEGNHMRALLTELHPILSRRIGASSDSSTLRLLTYTDRLLAAFSHPGQVELADSGKLIEPISERELEVLQLIDRGLTNQEIAERMVIAISTVKSHINSLYGKLGTHRRTQAVSIAREQGLIND